MKINILGTEYTIRYTSPKFDPRLLGCDGYTDTSTKEIVVDDMSDSKDDINAQADLARYRDKVTRHEIIHGFLAESGLDCGSEWAKNEEIVDWIAIQLPKIIKTCEQAKCTGGTK